MTDIDQYTTLKRLHIDRIQCVDATDDPAAEIAKLRANQQVLVDALEKVLIGGNHAANYLLGKMTPEDLDKLPPKTPPIIALHQLDNDVYDVWCCWASVMTAREALNKIKESENEV